MAERVNWVPDPSIGEKANQQLRKLFNQLDAAVRTVPRGFDYGGDLLNPDTLWTVPVDGDDVAVSLPAASTVPGFRVRIRQDGDNGGVVITPAAGDTIGGDDTVTLLTDGELAELVSDGSGWIQA